MHSEATLLRLIERIYDAALAPERWAEFLEALADALDGHFANIAYTNAAYTHTRQSAAVRFAPEAQRLYREHYAALDPWAHAAIQRGLMRTGVVGLGREIVSRHELEQTEFHNDFGRALGLEGGISAIIHSDARVIASVSISERRGGPTFSDADLLLVQRLLPHLQRAYQVHERLIGLAHASQAAEDVIDRMPFGVILLDANARPVLVNRAAQQILALNDGLTLRGALITASTTQQTAELRKGIASAISICGEKSTELVGPSAFAITRPSWKRALQLLITPLCGAASGLMLNPAAACAAIFVSDPESQPSTPAAMLRTFYGFTPAETRLASELLMHRTVEECAEILGISVNTARTQIKKLFEKTNTRRQSELLRVLSAGVLQFGS